MLLYDVNFIDSFFSFVILFFIQFRSQFFLLYVLKLFNLKIKNTMSYGAFIFFQINHSLINLIFFFNYFLRASKLQVIKLIQYNKLIQDLKMIHYQNSTSIELPNQLLQLVAVLRNTYSATDQKTRKQSEKWLATNIYLSPNFFKILQLLFLTNFEQQVKIAAANYLKKVLRQTKQSNISQDEFIIWLFTIIQNPNCSQWIGKSLCNCFQIVGQNIQCSALIQYLDKTLMHIKNSDSIPKSKKLYVLIESIILSIDINEYKLVYATYFPYITQSGCLAAQYVYSKINSINLFSPDYDQSEMNILEDGVKLLINLIKIFQTFLTNSQENQDILYQLYELMNQNQKTHNLFLTILKINFNNQNQIIVKCDLKIESTINNLKAIACQIINSVYQQPSKQFFEIYVETFFKNNIDEWDVQKNIIIQNMFTLLERAANSQLFIPHYANIKNHLINHIFNYFVTTKKQLQYMEQQPEHFVGLALDMCQDQQFDEIKTKAANFLSTLTQNVDGIFTLIVQICTVFIDYQFVPKQQKNQRFNFINQNLKKYTFWKRSMVEKVDVSLQILSCLYDQIQIRQQMKIIVVNIINYRFNQLLNTQSKLIVCRLILFCTFFPTTHYVTTFVQLLNTKNKLIYFQILEFIKKIFKYKRNQQYQEILSLHILKILNQVSCINPLFEDIVLHHFTILDTPQKIKFVINKMVTQIKKNYIQKFQYMNKQKNRENVLLLRNNNKIFVENVTQISNILQSFFSKIKNVINYEQQLYRLFQLMQVETQCNQNIVSVVTSYLRETKIANNFHLKFLQVCTKMIQKQQFCLNSCFQILNLHLIYAIHQNNRDLILQILLTCLQNNNQQTQNYEVMMLLEIYLLLCKDIQKINYIFNFIKKLFQNKSSLIIKNRLGEVYLSGVYSIIVNNLERRRQDQDIKALFHNFWLKNNIILWTSLSKKYHSLYLLSLIQYSIQYKWNNLEISSILRTVLQLFQEIEKQNQKKKNFQKSKKSYTFKQKYAQKKKEIIQSEQSNQNPYQIPNEIVVTCRLRQAKLIHPLKQIDSFQFFKTQIDLIKNHIPEILQGFQKSIITKYYQKRVILNSSRRILKIKR